MKPFKIPEMTSNIVNKAGWAVVQALPECPAIVFNHLKPAFYEGLKVVLEALLAQSALTQAMASEQGEAVYWEVTRMGRNPEVMSQAEFTRRSFDTGKFRALVYADTAQPAPAARPMDEADMLRCLGAATHEIPARIPAGWRKVMRAVEAHHGIGSQPTAPAVPAEFTDALRETAERSKAAPPGTLVQINPTVSAEFAKFQRGEPSAFDALSAAPAAVPAAPEVSEGWRTLPDIVRSIRQTIEHGYQDEQRKVIENPSMGTGLHTYLWHRMDEISAMLASAPTSTKGGAA